MTIPCNAISCASHACTLGKVTGVVPKTGRDVPPVGASVNITRTAAHTPNP